MADRAIQGRIVLNAGCAKNLVGMIALDLARQGTKALTARNRAEQVSRPTALFPDHSTPPSSTPEVNENITCLQSISTDRGLGNVAGLALFLVWPEARWMTDNASSINGSIFARIN